MEKKAYRECLVYEVEYFSQRAEGWVVHRTEIGSNHDHRLWIKRVGKNVQQWYAVVIRSFDGGEKTRNGNFHVVTFCDFERDTEAI